MLKLYRHLAWRRSKGYSVRVALSALVAAILIPALLFGGWLTLHSAEAERLQLEKNLHQQAQQIVSEVDREIGSTIYLLTALASSFALQTDNIEAFRQQTLELSRELKVQIVLFDPTINIQIMNTVAQGRPAPPAVPRRDAEEEMLRTRKPAISSVFFGRLVNRHVVGVIVPVLRDGQVVYGLGIGIPTDNFAKFLEHEQSAPGRIAAIID